MDGSESLKIQGNEAFRKNVERLVRDHYSKNKQGAAAFRELLADLIGGLLSNATPPNSRDEPWPHGTHRDGVQFRKLSFKMPRQHGAAREGRLMYIVDCERAVIAPVLVYTHKWFEQRPPARKLDELLAMLFSEE